MKNTIAFIGAALLASISSVRAEFSISGPGLEPAPIIVFKDAPPRTRDAAVTLADYIEKISGAKTVIIDGEPRPMPERAIWIGFQPVLKTIFPNTDFEFRNPEETLILANDPTSGFALLSDGGQVNYDSALPLLIVRYYPEGLMGLGVTALLAGFMAGQAGNVSAFNTVWTYDIYKALIRKDATDDHLLWMGRVTTIVGIIISVPTPTFIEFHSLLRQAIDTENFPSLGENVNWQYK